MVYIGLISFYWFIFLFAGCISLGIVRAVSLFKTSPNTIYYNQKYCPPLLQERESEFKQFGEVNG
jgi:hypothetical protein